MSFWRQYFPATVIIAFTCGLVAQFIWKMIYSPEPLVPVVIELVFIVALAGVAIWLLLSRSN